MEGAEQTVKKAAAASAGALVTSLFVTPLDVAKVRLQSQIHTQYHYHHHLHHSVVESRSSLSEKLLTSMPIEQCRCKCRGPCNRAVTRRVEKLNTRPGVLTCMRMSGSATMSVSPVKLTGTSHALRHIFRTEGVSGLFAGLSPAMMIAVPSTVLYYISYDLLLQEGRQRMPEMEKVVPLLAGTTARIVAATVTSPLELIRTRMQGDRNATGILRMFKQSIRAGGYSSLLNGLSATLARDVPFSAIYWTSYESLQQHMKDGLSLSRTQRAFLCGAISGSIAAMVTTPFDVVKTLQQVQTPTLGGTSPSGTMLLQQIVAKQGLSGAFTGLSARLARVAPSCGIMIGCYELGKERLGLV